MDGLAIALVAGLAGYLFRRFEHRREQRLTAYRSLLAAFFEAANTGATLLSIHLQTGYPWELKAKGRTPEDIDRFTKVHSEAWETASKARYRFDEAAFNIELIGSEIAPAVVQDLRNFLERALYSGAPWVRRDEYPSAGLNPGDIVSSAVDQARPQVRLLANELWPRFAWPKKQDST